MPSKRMRSSSTEVQQAARRLRRKETPAETILWRALRRNQLDGLHFRRQHALGRFVLDFYCASLRLAVELDGEVHDDVDQAARDHARSAALAAISIRVIRFRNEEVLGDLGSVLDRIRRAARPANGSPSVP
ncbi:MAG TPA: endonuclease domain-containing protein [Longimicrobiaceae bacterium]|nr:endonuclease domain-containing protein [Longimicrobiaceae bacterium]